MKTFDLVFMGLLFGVAYFFLIRPQAKRNREQQSFVDGISKGDQVVTTSGIYGKVMEVDEENNAVVLQIDRNKGINIRIAKVAISRELTAATIKEA